MRKTVTGCAPWAGESTAAARGVPLEAGGRRHVIRDARGAARRNRMPGMAEMGLLLIAVLTLITCTYALVTEHRVAMILLDLPGEVLSPAAVAVAVLAIAAAA